MAGIIIRDGWISLSVCTRDWIPGAMKLLKQYQDGRRDPEWQNWTQEILKFLPICRLAQPCRVHCSTGSCFSASDGAKLGPCQGCFLYHLKERHFASMPCKVKLRGSKVKHLSRHSDTSMQRGSGGVLRWSKPLAALQNASPSPLPAITSMTAPLHACMAVA